VSDEHHGLRMHAVVLDGQRLRYAVGGAPRARRSLLLFNGIGVRLEAIGPFAAAFRRTRLITFDVPGIGGSAHARWPFRPLEVAHWGAALLDHLGVARADACGVSWGGAAAQEFALHHPHRCRTLTLAATGATLAGLPAMPWRAARVGLDALLHIVPEWLSLHGQALRGIGSVGTLHQWLAAWNWSSWHYLHRLRLPALVLVGEHDSVVPPEIGQLVAACLPHGRVERIDGGHTFVLTRPVETAAAIETFVQRAGPKAFG
jgi:pimeloyl-ACP methyl ester carboxylesterase